MTEKEKMISGKLYNPLDKRLMLDRLRARLLADKYNRTRAYALRKRQRIIKALFPAGGADPFFEPTIHVEYGYNVTFGKNFYCRGAYFARLRRRRTRLGICKNGGNRQQCVDCVERHNMRRGKNRRQFRHRRGQCGCKRHSLERACRRCSLQSCPSHYRRRQNVSKTEHCTTYKIIGPQYQRSFQNIQKRLFSAPNAIKRRLLCRLFIYRL